MLIFKFSQRYRSPHLEVVNTINIISLCNVIRQIRIAVIFANYKKRCSIYLVVLMEL